MTFSERLAVAKANRKVGNSKLFNVVSKLTNMGINVTTQAGGYAMQQVANVVDATKLDVLAGKVSDKLAELAKDPEPTK